MYSIQKTKISLITIATIVMTIKVFMEESIAMPSNKYIDLIFTFIYLICVICVIVNNKYKIREFLIIGMVSIIMLYSALMSSNYAILITFLYIVAIKNRNIDTQIYYIFKCYVVLLTIHIIFTIVQYSLKEIQLVNFMRGKNRWSFGFNHPNTLGAVFLTMLIIYFWLNYSKLTRSNFVCSIISTIIIFTFSKSRTLLVLSFVTLALIYFGLQSKKIICNSISLLTKCLFPILSIVTYLLGIQYSKASTTAIAIDQALTGRIRLAGYAINRSGLTWLGQKIDYYGTIEYQSKWNTNAFTFDNVYSFLICNMGIIYVILLTVLFYKVAKMRDTKLNIFLIIWMLSGITEVNCLNGFNLFPIFLLGKMFISKPKTINEEGMVGL